MSTLHAHHVRPVAEHVLSEDTVTRCRRVLAVHSKSFALASRLLPTPSREYTAVVYAWCRRVDDAIDRARPGERGAALARVRGQLDDVYAGRSQSDMVLAAFQRVVAACHIPRHYPAALLAGMEMDVLGARYHTMHALHRYCFCVAGTVGLMMAHVMGVSRASALARAAHMGMAMQLTNICRDVLEDWDMGRLYVPDDVLASCGYPGLGRYLGRPFPDSARAPMACALRVLLGQAERLYASGDQGLPALSWRCALAVRAARLIYAAIGERIAATGHDVMAGRAVVPVTRKWRLVGRAGAVAAAELPGRALRAAWRASCEAAEQRDGDALVDSDMRGQAAARDVAARGLAASGPLSSRFPTPTAIIRFPDDVLPI